MSRPGLVLVVSVDDKPFPTPMTFRHHVVTLDLDSYTDLQGNLQRPAILGYRDRFEVVTPPLFNDKVDEITKMLKKDRIKIVFKDYYNPSVTRTKYFHHGDLVKEPKIIYNANKILYEPMSFTLTSYTVTND